MTAEFHPMLANALQFAFDKATMEGKITITALMLVSFISWTVMINKARQLFRARKQTKKFFAAWRQLRDPLELIRSGKEFHGSPEFAVYAAGAEELAYHLKNNPVQVKARRAMPAPGVLVDGVNTDHLAKASTTRISNAKQAMDSCGEERRLTVRIHAGAGDRVLVEIADNGMGIPPENLTRIFNHGFTTKKTGHGFGLHGSVIAAREMGGSLIAHSDGKGHGACFTLLLPARTVNDSTRKAA